MGRSRGHHDRPAETVSFEDQWNIEEFRRHAGKAIAKVEPGPTAPPALRRTTGDNGPTWRTYLSKRRTFSSIIEYIWVISSAGRRRPKGMFSFAHSTSPSGGLIGAT